MKSRRKLLSTAALLTAASALALSLPGLAAAPPAAGFMRQEFTWTGEAVGDDFDAHCNWHPGLTCNDALPYPDDTGDNATFPWIASGAWACDLVGESIGDLTLEGKVDFNTAGGTVTLSAVRLYIEPTQGDIEITVSGATQITVP